MREKPPTEYHRESKKKKSKSNTLVTNTCCQRGISKHSGEKNGKRKINTFTFLRCYGRKKKSTPLKIQSFDSTVYQSAYSTLHAKTIFGDNTSISHSLTHSPF